MKGMTGNYGQLSEPACSQFPADLDFQLFLKYRRYKKELSEEEINPDSLIITYQSLPGLSAGRK